MPPTIDAPAPASVEPQAPGQINVSQMPKTAAPAAPPKPGSARERMRQELSKKAGIEPKPEPKVEPKAEPKSAGAPAPSTPKEAPVKPPEGTSAPDAPKPSGEPTAKPEAGTVVDDSKDKRISPWKLVDTYKERLARTEKELADMRSNLLPEADRKTIMERAEAIEKRNKELEDEIRFVNYTKSKDFKDKYQEPYDRAWNAAMNELRELTIDDGTGNKRAVGVDDLLTLVNMPLGKAREIADSLFGNFADDVMAHRKEIRSLFEVQQKAIEDAKKESGERDRIRQETFQKQMGEVTKSIAETWGQVNSQVLESKLGEYFKNREGDDAWNEQLTKGFELVDLAFKESPMAPGLTPEQRTERIKRHAAIRNRAAGWGPLRHENGLLKTKITELEAELKKYKESTPAAGGTLPQAGPPSSGSARDRMFSDLGKLVRPQ